LADGKHGDKYLNPPTVWTTTPTKLAKKNDILMSVRAPVGALNFANQTVCIGRGLAAIRASSQISNDYLFYALLQLSSKLKGSSGAIFNSINKKQIEDITFALPPLEEQKAIVAKLDKAFAEIDKAIVASNAQANNVSALKSRFITSKFTTQIKGKPLGECCEFLNGYAFKSGDAIKTSDTQLLRMGNLYENKLDLKRKPAFYPDYYATQHQRYVLEHGDIVMTLTGTVGKKDYGYALKIENMEKTLLLNQRILKLHKFNHAFINQDFLLYFLQSEPFLSELYATANGTRQANLSSDTIKKLKIPLPSLEEQEKAVDAFKSIEGIHHEAFECLTRKISNLNALKFSILAQELQSEAA